MTRPAIGPAAYRPGPAAYRPGHHLGQHPRSRTSLHRGTPGVAQRRSSRALGAGLAAVAAAALLAGCAVGEAVSARTDEVISSAACAALVPVVDGVTPQVDAAVREIEADPAAAKAALDEARAAVAGAAAAGGETVGSLLEPVTAALDGLIDLAAKAESGVAVNDEDRTGAAQAVDDALAGLTARCT